MFVVGSVDVVGRVWYCFGMTNANIYEYLEDGGNVYDDIADMSLDDMLDYFGDLDPTLFL